MISSRGSGSSMLRWRICRPSLISKSKLIWIKLNKLSGPIIRRQMIWPRRMISWSLTSQTCKTPSKRRNRKSDSFSRGAKIRKGKLKKIMNRARKKDRRSRRGSEIKRGRLKNPIENKCKSSKISKRRNLKIFTLISFEPRKTWKSWRHKSLIRTSKLRT